MPALTAATIERLNDAMTKLLEAAALLRIVRADYAATFPTRIYPVIDSLEVGIEEIEAKLLDFAADRERMKTELKEASNG